MHVEKWIRLIAGTFVLASPSLGYLHHAHWHIFTAFAGLNLIQSVFTNRCLAETILLKACVRERCGGGNVG